MVIELFFDFCMVNQLQLILKASTLWRRPAGSRNDAFFTRSSIFAWTMATNDICNTNLKGCIFLLIQWVLSFLFSAHAQKPKFKLLSCIRFDVFFFLFSFFPLCFAVISSFVVHFIVFLSYELWLANFPGNEEIKSGKSRR